MLSRIAFGNLWRRKGRTCLLITGLAIGVALVITLTGVTLALKTDIEHKLDEYGANILVTPMTESLSLTYGGVDIAKTSYRSEVLEEGDIERIRTIRNNRNISVVAPKVIGSSTVEGREVLIEGVRFPEEFRLKKWWRLEGKEHAHTGRAPMPEIVPEREVLIGRAVAKALKIGQGDQISLGRKKYTVKGVLEENASQDDVAIFMDLPEAQRILDMRGKLSLIEVSALCAQCPIEDIVAQIGEKLPRAKVSAVRQAMTLRMETVDQIVRFALALSVAVMIVGALIVFVSMTSSVNERVREIGVLRAIGYGKVHIMTIILEEAFAVSFIGGLAGWVAGSFAVHLAAARLTETGVPFFQLSHLVAAMGLSVIIGMGSSIYPALSAARLDPFEALRAL